MPDYTVTEYGPYWLLTIGTTQQPFVSKADAESEGDRLVTRALHPPIAWIRIRSHTYPIPHGAEPTTCASCGAAIVWTRTPGRAPIPLSLATAHEENGRRVALSHFTDCEHAKEWSKAR